MPVTASTSRVKTCLEALTKSHEAPSVSSSARSSCTSKRRSIASEGRETGKNRCASDKTRPGPRARLVLRGHFSKYALYFSLVGNLKFLS